MKTFIADKNRKLSKLALYHIEDLSFSSFMKALRKKDVKVNGKRVSADLTLNVGDKVEIYYSVEKKDKFSIIYLDENVLVIDKKSGYTSESVFEEIKQNFPNAQFIHRLDRNTNGVMIFALNKTAEELLLKGFKERTFVKKYHALVVGAPKKEQDILSAYLIKDAVNSTVKIYDKQVKDSVIIKTGYKIIEKHAQTSLLEVELFTGKTHQIRAHLAHIGHPIVGDGKYGDFNFNEKVGVKSQKLTAFSLTLKFDGYTALSYLDGKTFTVKKILKKE